jgi:hypothetical protein
VIPFSTIGHGGSSFGTQESKWRQLFGQDKALGQLASDSF